MGKNKCVVDTCVFVSLLGCDRRLNNMGMNGYESFVREEERQILSCFNSLNSTLVKKFIDPGVKLTMENYDEVLQNYMHSIAREIVRVSQELSEVKRNSGRSSKNYLTLARYLGDLRNALDTARANYGRFNSSRNSVAIRRLYLDHLKGDVQICIVPTVLREIKNHIYDHQEFRLKHNNNQYVSYSKEDILNLLQKLYFLEFTSQADLDLITEISGAVRGHIIEVCEAPKSPDFIRISKIISGKEMDEILSHIQIRKTMTQSLDQKNADKLIKRLTARLLESKGLEAFAEPAMKDDINSVGDYGDSKIAAESNISGVQLVTLNGKDFISAGTNRPTERRDRIKQMYSHLDSTTNALAYTPYEFVYGNIDAPSKSKMADRILSKSFDERNF